MFKQKLNFASFKLWTMVLILALILATLNPFFLVQVHAVEQIPTIPTVNAQSIYVMDARTGTELYAKQPDEYISTEALLPLLISMVVLDEKNLDDNLLINSMAQNMSTQITGNSGKVGLEDGERLSVRQLLSALLMAQSQDVVVALSGIFSDDAEFISKIQDKVTEFGLQKTKITSPLNGSTLTDHTTTRDLGLVMQKFLEYPELVAINGQADFSFTPNNMVPEPRTIQNSNLQFKKDSDLYLSELIAGQYASANSERPQNNSYVGAAKNTQGLFIVALGGSLESQDNYSNSETLFEWAFNHFKAVLLIEKDEILSSLPLADGNSLGLRAEKDVYHLINASLIKPAFSLNLNPGESLQDTVEKDQVVATAEIIIQGQKDVSIGTVNLLANRSANLMEESSLPLEKSFSDRILGWVLKVGVVLLLIASLIFIIRTINLMRRSKRRQEKLRARRSELEEKLKDEIEQENKQQRINRSNF